MKSAVSLSLKRRFLLHMRFLEPVRCRSELETEVCTLEQVSEPQRPLPFPVLLTSFMQESQQHPERERKKPPHLPPPLSITTYSLKGDHFCLFVCSLYLCIYFFFVLFTSLLYILDSTLSDIQYLSLLSDLFHLP